MEMLQKSNSAHEFSKFEVLQKNLEASMNIIIESKKLKKFVIILFIVRIL